MKSSPAYLLMVLALGILGGPAVWAQGAATRAAEAKAHGSVAAMPVVGVVGLALNTAEVTGQIRQTDEDARVTMLSMIESRIEATGRSVDRWQRAVRRLEGDIRSRAEEAIGEVKAREKALRSSLREARRASVQEWSEARERVASDYEAYAQAVACAEAGIGSLETNGLAANTRSVTRH